MAKPRLETQRPAYDWQKVVHYLVHECGLDLGVIHRFVSDLIIDYNIGRSGYFCVSNDTKESAKPEHHAIVDVIVREFGGDDGKQARFWIDW